MHMPLSATDALPGAADDHATAPSSQAAVGLLTSPKSFAIPRFVSSYVRPAGAGRSHASIVDEHAQN